MYITDKPDSNSISQIINKNFNDINWRIWLPKITTNNYITPDFDTISYKNNTNFDVLLGEVDNSDADLTFNFEVPFLSKFKPNSQLTFLFGFLDSNNEPVKIISEPKLNIEKQGYYDLTSSLKYPLLSFRLENPNDIFSLDLWSFKLLSEQTQRAGISILNNVINPINGEETILRITLPEEKKNIKIMVMTLDGNIVKYLNKSQPLSAGEHNFYWDGKNNANKPVARGLYFIRIMGDGIDETRKVMIVK